MMAYQRHLGAVRCLFRVGPLKIAVKFAWMLNLAEMLSKEILAAENL